MAFRESSPGCVYAPGFLEALRAVVERGRALRAVPMPAEQPWRRERLSLVAAAQQEAKRLQAQPEMCDKFLSLDSREPFLSTSVSEEGDEPLGP